MNGFYRFIKGLLNVAMHILYRVRCVGTENIPASGGFVLCCNHTSMSDIFHLIALCPRQISFMAKAELFKSKIVGFVLRNMSAFPVDRSRGDKSAIKNALAAVNNDGILGIFPEGTRKKEGPPARGKAGAAFIASSCSADILPVCIYRKGKQHLFGRVTVRFGNLIKYSETDKEEKLSKSAIKETTDLIMKNINSLWEMGY